MNTDLYRKLIVCQMALDGVPTATIEVFQKTFPHLIAIEGNPVNGQIVAELASMSSQAAGRHLNILTKRKFLERKNHRAWLLSKTLFRDPDVISLSRHIYS